MKEAEVRRVVRQRYGSIAAGGGSCCGAGSPCCGTGSASSSARRAGEAVGYTAEQMSSVPEGANLGLGCGNPLALAALTGGETVVDLGAGAGFDCFLAARRVGERGRVIGVDMTPQMVEKARENAVRGGYSNVEFRLGEIESLPVADRSADLLISNCVINLSVDKARVFREAFRVLKPGGRLMISDMVLIGELPGGVLESAAAYAGCVAGALQREEYLRLIGEAGFEQVQVLREESFRLDTLLDEPSLKGLMEEWRISASEAEDAAAKIASVSVSAVRPG